jgi:hypothetical protein
MLFPLIYCILLDVQNSSAIYRPFIKDGFNLLACHPISRSILEGFMDTHKREPEYGKSTSFIVVQYLSV